MEIQHYNATVQFLVVSFPNSWNIFCSLHFLHSSGRILYVGNRICSNTKAEKTILGAYSVKELDYV